MVDIKDLDSRVKDWAEYWDAVSEFPFAGGSYIDAVNLVCDAEKMKIRDDYDYWKSVGVLDYKESLGKEYRDVRRVRNILLKRIEHKEF